jgi:predicted PurR-regulated permease PerM
LRRKKPLKQSDLIRIWTRVVLRMVFLLTFISFLIWVLYLLRKILLLLILSVFFCYLIAPLVRLFEHPVYVRERELKLPRSAAIGMVYLLLGGLVFGLISWAWPILWNQVTELGQKLPQYISTGSTSVREYFNDANSWVRHLRLPREWRDYLLGITSRMIETIGPYLEAIVGSLLSYLQYLPWLILVPVLSFFMLKDATRFEQSVVSMLPNEKLRKRVHWMLLDVSSTLAAYTRAQILSCLVVGAQVTIIFNLLGVPYAYVLGVIAAVLEFIPMAGPLVAAIIAVSLTMTSSFNLALVVALTLAILRIVHDYLVYPRIVGQGIKMHPMVVVLAILVGAELGGLPGIFLAIPFVGLVMVGYHHYRAYRESRDFRPPPRDEKTTAPLEEATPAQTPELGFHDLLADAGASLISSDIQSEASFEEEATLGQTEAVAGDNASESKDE